MVQLPDRTGVAGVGPSACEAWRALAARLASGLDAAPTWLVPLPV